MPTPLHSRGDPVTFFSGLFIIILAGMALGAITEVAKALARRGTSASELSQLRHQVEQLTAALDEAQTTFSEQAAEVAELQERLDFAERLLAQARDRAALGSGRPRE
jgi:septal ring factor EnvC (AmiA/AmiB activator)